MIVKWNETAIEFDIIYSQRKSVGINLDEHGNVTVRAPKHLKLEEAEKIILKKASWILKKKNELENKQKMSTPKQYVDGELFLYLGEEMPLNIVLNPHRTHLEVIFKGDQIKVRTPVADPHNLRRAMEGWYRYKTEDFVLKCIHYYKTKFPTVINRVLIKEQKSRWGSCSSKGNLNFNWRLSMAPPEVIEYIVVHEMCHLVHMNHSKEFWTLVESMVPDHKKHKEWLKTNGRMLYSV